MPVDTNANENGNTSTNTSANLNANINEHAPRNMVQQVLPFALIHGEAVLEKPQDLFIPPDALEIMLENFSGPLDLLLYLIRKQKFNILDLPILPITKQYIEYVYLMKTLKLELAAEYLVMAATLAEIKSRLLLPKQTIENEDVDPRAELMRRLKAYEVIKESADKVDGLPRLERDLYIAQATLADNFQVRTQHADVNMNELLSALSGVIKRSQALAHHQIKKETLSTRERMSAILLSLRKNQQGHQNIVFIEFSQLFALDEGRTGVVVTFLAILALIKESLITCLQADIYGQIQISLPSANIQEGMTR